MGDEAKTQGRATAPAPQPRTATASLTDPSGAVTVRLTEPEPECYVGTLTASEHTADGVREGLIAEEPDASLLHATKIAPVLNLDLCVMYASIERLPPTRHLLVVRVPGNVKKKQLGLRTTFHDALDRPDQLEPVDHTFVFDLPDERPCYLLFLPVCYDGDPSTVDVGDGDEEPALSLDDVDAFYQEAGVHLLDVTDDSEWGHAKTMEVGYVGKSEDTLQSVVTLSLLELVPPVDVDEVGKP